MARLPAPLQRPAGRSRSRPLADGSRLRGARKPEVRERLDHPRMAEVSAWGQKLICAGSSCSRATMRPRAGRTSWAARGSLRREWMTRGPPTSLGLAHPLRQCHRASTDHGQLTGPPRPTWQRSPRRDPQLLQIYSLYSQKEFRYNNIAAAQSQSHSCRTDPDVDGMKTGHTEAAGFGLIASARRGKRACLPWSGSGKAIGRASDGQQLLN